MTTRSLSELLDTIPVAEPRACRAAVKVNGALFNCRGGHGARSYQHTSVFKEHGVYITVRWSTDDTKRAKGKG